MLQIYESALTPTHLQCVFDGGANLVHNRRMAQDAASDCRGRVATGCTSRFASNFDASLPEYAVDDGFAEVPP